jgi:FHS family L-fucose permease-like MFS transporter
MFTSGNVAIWTLVLCGFFNSIMFPNIFTLGIFGLGPMTSKGSGLIMTAVVGGAVIPWLIGEVADKYGRHYATVHQLQFVPGGLADKIGIQGSFVIPVICYLYIAFYGLWGSKPTRTVTA